MTLKTRVISDPGRLVEVEESWKKLIEENSDNPFLLSGFAKQSMKFKRISGWTPLVLVTLADNKVVGIAPLCIKKKFGVQFVKFLLEDSFSPDFILDDQYRENCIAHFIDFLFKNVRCRFVQLTLSVESPNLLILKQKCKSKAISLFLKPAMGHLVLPIRSTWNEFEASKGRSFREKFKRIKRNLDRAGSWKIKCFENGNEEEEVLKQIIDVERMSWKEKLRVRMGVEMDKDLMMIWNESRSITETLPDFNWSVWFLELNDQIISYLLVLQYKNTAFFTKSSYDSRYRRFSPGIFLQNAVIRELFYRKKVKNIDFLTALPFIQTWTSVCIPRVKIMMMRKGISSRIIYRGYQTYLKILA